MKRLLIAVAALLVLAPGAKAADCNTYSGTGAWTDVARWSAGHVPTGTEDACIPAGATVSVTANATLSGSLTVAGTLDLPVAGRYLNKSGSGAIRVTGLVKGVGMLYPPVDNAGRVEGVELYGGGSGGGEFAGSIFKQGTYAVDGAHLTGVALAGATVNGSGTLSGTMSGGVLGGTGTFTVDAPLTWSGGTMDGTGVTRVTSTLTHTNNTTLGRTLEVAGTLDMSVAGEYVNKTGAGAIRVTGLVKGAGMLYPPVENAGRVEGVELYGGGSGSGEFAGSIFKQGTYAVDGAHLTGVTIAGATVNGSATASGTMSAGVIGGAGTFTIDGPFTWSGGTMSGTGTTVVTSTLTHTANVTLGRALDVSGTLDMVTAGKYIALATGGSIHVGGLLRGTTGSIVYPPVDADGRVQGVELQGGGAGSTGDFAGVAFKSGTFSLDGASLTDATVAATVSGAASVSGTSKMTAGSFGVGDVSGTFDWSGGKLAGAGTTRIAAGATLALSGSVSLTGGRVLENRGLIDVKGDVLVFDDFDAPAELIVNLGTIRKTAGTSTGGATLAVPLRNAGVVDGKVGRLRLEGGDTVADTGTFTGTDAASHVVLGEARTLSGSAVLGGVVEIAGDVAVKAGETLVAGAELWQTGGDVTGDLRVTGTLRWDGGAHAGPGTTTIAAGGRVLVTPLGSGTCADASLQDGRRVVNQGLLRIERGDLYSNDTNRPEIENAGRIEIDAGTGDACAASGLSGDALLHNAGTIEKLGGTADARLSVLLDNDGTVLSSAGDLSLSSGSTVAQAGAFRSAAGASVTLSDGVLLLEPTATFGGTFVVGDGELRIPAGMTVTVPAGETLRVDGGTIGGEGALAIAGTLDWRGGEQAGGGSTLIAPGGAVVASGFTALREDRAVVNRGTFTVNGTLFMAQGASVLNKGVLLLGGGAKLDGAGLGYGSGLGALVSNTGILRKTGAGTAVAEVAVDNDGTVDVAGGSLELPGLLNYSGLFFGGRAGLAGGAYVVADGASLVLPGELEANGARLELGAGSSVGYRALGGQGAVSDALTGLARNMPDGELVLRRAVTLPAFLNEGTLTLGATVSAASFRQSAGGLLRTTGGRLAVAGAATLAGRLDTPPAGPDIAVLSAGGLTGTFASVTGGYDAVYGADAVTLRAHGASATPVAELPASVAVVRQPLAAPAAAPSAARRAFARELARARSVENRTVARRRSREGSVSSPGKRVRGAKSTVG